MTDPIDITDPEPNPDADVLDEDELELAGAEATDGQPVEDDPAASTTEDPT